MAHIRFDIDTVRPNDTGSALGQIWVELSDRAVPCPRWDDFIVFILDWWRRGIEDILSAADTTRPFAFMDSEYDFSAVKSDDGYIFRFNYQEEEIYAAYEDGAGVRSFVLSYFAAVRAIIARIEQDPQWRKTYLGSAGTLDDIKAEQPRLEALLAKYL